MTVNMQTIKENLRKCFGHEYVESEYCYVVPGEEYLDTTYVDGEELDTSNWEEVYQIVTIKESINIFNGNKAIMGYLKSGIGCIYVSTNGEWSRVAFGTELGERGDFPKGNVIVRTEDLKAVMEVADTEEGYGPNVMSDSVKEYFDRIREGIVEENKKREAFEKENPGATLPPLEETASVDGLEHFETFNFRFNSEEDYMMVMDVIRQLVYNQGYTKYYIEYVSETSETVEFKFYVGK